MLVKFLSFVATIFGTAKYKAILVSSFALLLSVSSILAVILTQPNSASQHNASAIIRSVAGSLGVQDGTADVSHFTVPSAANSRTSNQPTQTSNTQQTTTAETKKSKPTNSETTTGQSGSSASSSAVSIATTAKAPLTLSAGQTSSTVTDTTNDSSSVIWTVVPSDSTDLSITPTPSSQATSSINFQVAAGSNTPNGNYQITVTTKDASGTIVATTTLDVTIQ